MNTKKNTVYYSNEDGLGARISRDLISEVFNKLSKIIKSPSTLGFIEKTRIPNERELYGVFISALNKALPGLGHIATEFQVGRSEDAKGRVDFFFEYRNVSFLLELKLARIGLGGEFNDIDDEVRDTKARVTKPWVNGVVEQLKNLETVSLSSCLQKKVVKIAMVIYLHVDWRKSGPQVNWKKMSKPTHDLVIADLRGDEPEFSYFSVLKQPIRTRKRRTALSDEHDMSMYGFTFVASTFIA
jgi:hypothetical protein